MKSPKALSSVLVLTLSLTILAQNQEVAQPDPMQNLSFMAGEWEGKQKFLMGSELQGAVLSSVQFVISGRYLEESLKITMPDGKVSDTRHFTIYDPDDKKYHAWWFNTTSNSPMEFVGDIQGKNLVMVSKPVKLGSHMDTFRVTYENLGDASYGYELEFMNEDTPWTRQFQTVYARKQGPDANAGTSR